LQYLRARTYHTKHQQFISEDTIVGSDTNPLSQNRYTFAMNNPYKYADPSGNVTQAFTEDGKIIVEEPEKKKQTIQDEVADQQADLALNYRSDAPLYDDLGTLERKLVLKTKDSINTSNQGFTENTINIQNPYNNQLKISGNKENNSNKGYNENTFIKDGLNFINERLSVIGDVLKSVLITKLVISTNAIVYKSVELLCLKFTGGFALISGVTASP